MQYFRKYALLLIIIVLGTCLRLYDLPRGDAITDEVLYGFRAIQYLDFDFAVAQPSTPQLVAPESDVIPPWTKLSFHDHPPLVFAVQHWFMRIFGADLFGMRLSSALFGIASIIVLYLIAEILFSKRVAAISAAFMATNVLMIYVSRTGIQESQVIFFIVLTVLLFLKAQKDPRWYYGWGIAFGLGLLSKYTAGFLIIPFALYVVCFARTALREKKLYLGMLAALVLLSPVLIYNLRLFQELGHFDFQLSYIFGQEVSYWQVTPGKEIGTIADRFTGIFTNSWFFNSPLTDVLSLAGLITVVFQVFKKESEMRQSALFLLFLVGSNMALFLAIGPSPRFLSMIAPWLLLCVGVLFGAVIARVKMSARFVIFTLLALALLWETFFSINSYIVSRPVGNEVVHYSRIHWDMHPWGYNELEEYLDTMLTGRYPAYTVGYGLPWLNEIKRQAILRGEARGLKPMTALIVFNDNMANLASLWYLSRRALYDGWPIITADTYHATVAAEGEHFYRDQGFTELYFIDNTDAVLLNEPDRLSEEGSLLADELAALGARVEELINIDGKVSFRVYHVSQ